MGITNSQVIEDSAQIDGRRAVTYRFTWAEGFTRDISNKLAVLSRQFDERAERVDRVIDELRKTQ